MRNHFKGAVDSIKLGGVMAEVILDIVGGDQVISAIIKSTEDIIGSGYGVGSRRIGGD